MKNIKDSVFVACLISLLSSSVFAAIPDLIPVQGSVGDADGKPLNGGTDMTFEIYDAEEDGELLYRSVYDDDTTQVDVDEGFFTVYLGELDEYPIEFTDLFAASQLWLQMVVNDEALDTRIQLASVPFAHQAKTCEQIGDLAEGDIQPAIGEACENGQFLRGWDNETDKPICGADKISQDASAVANWEEMINIPEGFADGADDGFTTEGQLTSMLDDNYIGNGQADSVTSGMITDGTIGAADVNTAAVQIRGSKTSCDSGKYVSGIGADGNVSCKNDVDTKNTYTAGDGIAISSGEVSVDESWLDSYLKTKGYRQLSNLREYEINDSDYDVNKESCWESEGKSVCAENVSAALCFITEIAVAGSTSTTHLCKIVPSNDGKNWQLEWRKPVGVSLRCGFACFTN